MSENILTVTDGTFEELVLKSDLPVLVITGLSGVVRAR